MSDFFVGSKPFELPHLMVVLFFAVVLTGLILILKYAIKSEKGKVVFIKSVAMFTFILTLLSKPIYLDWNLTFIEFLPNGYCGFMGWVLPLVVIFSTKDSKLLYYACMAGLLGGALTVLSGDNIGQVKFENTIISMAYHGMMFVTGVLVFVNKNLTPTLDKLSGLFTGYVVMMVITLFMRDMGQNFDLLFIYSDMIPGINWWSMALIIFPIFAITGILYEHFTREKEERTIVKYWRNTKSFCKEYSLKIKKVFSKNKEG